MFWNYFVCGITDELLTEYAEKVKSLRHYLESEDKYGMTVAGKLFEGDTKKRHFHIILDHTLEKKHRSEFYMNLSGKEKTIQKAINRKAHYSEEQLKSFRQYFDLSVKEDGDLTTSKRRRNKGKAKKEKAYVITAAEKNYDRINNDLKKCGFYILVTSEAITTEAALIAYRKSISKPCPPLHRSDIPTSAFKHFIRQTSFLDQRGEDPGPLSPITSCQIRSFRTNTVLFS